MLSAHDIRPYLKEFNFENLFIEKLGWDHHPRDLPITVTVNQSDYQLTPVAYKRVMGVFECTSTEAKEHLPDYATRRKIHKWVSDEIMREHFIIYTNFEKTTQIWQWVEHEQGTPIACREHRYDPGYQSGESLIQKLRTIAFSFEEEGEITGVDVIQRVRSGFYAERVTKKFFNHFENEHKAFLEFLKGIPDEEMQRWYASVMLNRLMFIYFIQKKGFLDNDIDYLRSKLAGSRRKGKNRYYKEFLCPLFFEGFAKPETKRSRDIKRLLGSIPYLNGGIFQKHQLETLHGENIKIPDKAFEQIFDFFDQYQWHLDDRPLQNDKEINPDVLGYIFEKYINQKELGAYYTKEDITGYISRNAIIPTLFDKVRNAFEGDAAVWHLLQDQPDRYIYDTIKKGVDLELPEDIAVGIDDVCKRTDWNTLAPEEYALPTEIWREVVARRQRYETVLAKLIDGEIRDIKDLVTYNLNIRRFAQDVIEDCDDPELLLAFWNVITEVTILDPTCGSGAFLFAALNILKSLYESCLDRMQAFLDEASTISESQPSRQYNAFSEILERIALHPNREYFVLKSIIINNLYGVDIMEEAIEICKLRLFLKMVAQIEDVRRIEPLPDIDFNILAGNTLVGYTTYDEVEEAVTGRFDFDDTMDRIKGRAEDVEKFRKQQTQGDGTVTLADKQALQNKLQVLKDELNSYLAREYKVDISNDFAYSDWLDSHKPFHWFIAFYGILNEGGFDVIIGNPPYRSIKKVNYSVRDYDTIECGDLFALCCERSADLNHSAGSLAMIIPLNGYSTEAMSSLRNLLLDSYSENHLSYFSASDQPASLFTGVRHRLMIFINRRSSHKIVSTTRFLKWFRIEREFLFTSILKSHSISSLVDLPANSKLASQLEESILKKILEKPTLGIWRRKRGSKDSAIYYHNAPVHWGKVFDFIPFYQVGESKPTMSSHIKCLFYNPKELSKIVLCFLNSSLFYWWNWHFTNCRDLPITNIDRARIDLAGFSQASIEALNQLSFSLMADLRKNSKIYKRVSKGVLTKFDSFYPALSKSIIDDIDRMLAKHYGFTDEELDFIINYDIKYRMGLGN